MRVERVSWEENGAECALLLEILAFITNGDGHGSFGEHGVEQEQKGAGDDAGVGDVEVGEMIAEDVDFNEVDDGAVEDAVVDVAEGSAEDEGECDGGDGEFVAKADEGDEHGEGGEEREADEDPADQVRRGGFSEQREGGAVVGPVGDAEDVGDDGDGAAERDAGFHHPLGDAVSEDDERGEEHEPGQAAWDGQAHWAASSVGGSMPISLSAPWQRVQTFCQMP